MKWIAASLGLVCAFVFAEGALRLGGFSYHIYPTVQFGWPDPKTIADVYHSDPDLLWVTRDFADKIAQARSSHPAVIFLGDSCTEFGTYPSQVIEHLREAAPDLASGIKFGVGGWSSEQGLTLLRRDILALPVAPKVVTIYFGWNDHWVALGPTDADLTFARRFAWPLEHLRLVQMAARAYMGRFGDISKRPNRVPIERYRVNLDAMIRETEAKGIRPVVITAPSNHIAGREPDYLKLRHLRALSELVPLHTQYADATRDAARSGHATLCDAADAFKRLPGPPDQYFRNDGIHLTERGDQAMAAIVANCITHPTDAGARATR